MIIEEGKGEGKIQVGISTFADVVKVYGKKYKLNFHIYSYEMEFSELGISFYYNGTFPERNILLRVLLGELYERSFS